MAELAKLHRTQIGNLERASSGATVDTVGQVAQAIGVTASVLLEPPEMAHPKILASLGKRA